MANIPRESLLLTPAVLALAACVAEGPALPELSLGRTTHPQTTDLSVLSTVKQGMTLQDVSRLIGPAVASADDPGQTGHSCFAHPYFENGQQRFVHSVYLGGNLTGIKAGFDDVCGPQDFR